MTYESLTANTDAVAIYSNLFNTMPGSSILLRADAPRYTIVAATPAFSTLTGIKKEDLLSRGLFDVFPSNPNDPNDTGEKRLGVSLAYVLEHKVAQELPVLRYDSELRTGEFMERYWRSTNAPVLNEAGEVVYIIHSTEEVTAEVKAGHLQQKLKGLELLHDLFMKLPGVVGIAKGPENVLVLANDSALRLWGKGKEIIGQPLSVTIPELEGQGVFELFDQVRKTGQPYFANEVPVTTLRTGVPETLYFDIVYLPYYDEDTAYPTGVFTMSYDVTETVLAKQRAEAAQKESDRQKRLYEAVTGSTPDLIYVFDLDYRFTYANKALLDMWGKTWAEAAEKRLLENGYEPWHAEMHEREIDQVVATKKPVRGEVSFPHATLGKRLYDYIFVPVFNEQGEVEAVAGTTRDITDIKQAEDALKQSEGQLQQKVTERTSDLEHTVEELRRSNANLEEFAYAASHDLKEPIRKIHFFGDRIKETIGNQMTPEVKRYFERMDSASQRMGSLIDDLLSYSQVSVRPRTVEDVDLSQLLEQVVEELDLEIEDKEAVVTIDKLFTIKGHQRQLQQAFQNLIGNALKYNKPGVAPHINVSYRKVAGRETGLHLTAEERERVFYCIDIRDNGIGFEQADAERIFNVFTRLHGMAEYKGTGIGLSIVRKVIENHDGHIWATSQPGQGATFHILLPAEV